MRFARIPVIWLPVIAFAMAALGALFTATIDQVTVRGAYQIWQENETFTAATIALLAAMIAARPVYLQVRAQSVQAALDLLHRTEVDTEACVEARKRLYDVRHAALMLAGALNPRAAARNGSMQALKTAVDGFLAISPRHLSALAERATINSADQMKIATLSCVLSVAQQVAADILAQEEEGEKTLALAAQEHEFISTKLAGLFLLSSEITEDIEAQEEAMRARAQQLREAAETL
jgi:hypothetical protein